MTSGSPVKLTEMHAQVSRESAGGADTFQGGSPTLTWTLPCGAGTRSSRTSLNTTINSSAFNDTTTLLLEYVPNSRSPAEILMTRGLRDFSPHTRT